MPLRVLTPAPVARLVSLEALKASIGTTDRTDAELEALLKGVARAYANFLGWPLPRQGYEETASGNGRARLLLAARPLDRDSLAVELAGTAITDFSIEDADHGVLYRRCAWPTCRERVGEEGEIKELGLQFRVINHKDDVLTTYGKVVEKTQENGQNLVRLEVDVRNQEGQKTSPGHAVVALPSRG